MFVCIASVLVCDDIIIVNIHMKNIFRLEEWKEPELRTPREIQSEHVGLQR